MTRPTLSASVRRVRMEDIDRVSVRLPEKMRRELAEVAAKNERSIGAEIRLAIREYLRTKGASS